MAALIDGDLFAYRAAAAAETETDWGDDFFTIHSNVEDAYRIFVGLIEPCQKRKFGALRVAFSSKTNFRKDVYPGYKSNRTYRKPVGYAALVEKIRERWDTEVYDGLEADDLLGLHSKTMTMITEDKDLRGVPGKLYHPGLDRLEKIDRASADRFFYTQILIGDSTDGYPGCPGIGEKRAEAILEGVEGEQNLWKAVLEAYLSKGLTEEDAIAQARCARILRPGEYKNKKVKLWTPPI
jgi:DNA polymerase-1